MIENIELDFNCVGYYVLDYIQQNNLTINDFISKTSLDYETFNSIIHGMYNISEEIAIELEKATKINYRVWLDIDKEYINAKKDLNTSRKRMVNNKMRKR